MKNTIACKDVLECPACGASGARHLFTIREHEYDNTTSMGFPLAECASCSARFLSSRPEESETGTIYPPNYYAYVLDAKSANDLKVEQKGLFSRLSEKLFRSRLAPLLAHVPLSPCTRWLEIGCGRGSSLQSLKSFFGVQGEGVDLSAEAVDICRKRGFVAQATRFEDFTPQQTACYDVIHSSHVIEHVASPKAFLQKQLALLKDGGVCVFVTPNTDTWESRAFKKHWGGLHAPRHWTLFNERSAKTLAESVGFQWVATHYSTNGVFWVWSAHSWLQETFGRKPADALCPSDDRFVNSSFMNLVRLGLGSALDTVNRALTGRSANMTIILRKPSAQDGARTDSAPATRTGGDNNRVNAKLAQVYASQFKLRFLLRKPLLVWRIALHALHTLLTGKTRLCSVDIGVTKKCNLRCKHCYASNFLEQETIDLEILGKGIKEAIDMGAWHFLLLGGEPLADPKRLERVITLCEPWHSYITIVTNGYTVTEEQLAHYHKLGVDKIGVSLESFIPEEHELNRNQPGCYEHARRTIDCARKVGLSVAINTTVSRESFNTTGFWQMVQFTRDTPDIPLDVNIAMPVGNWEGRRDLMLTPEQISILEEQFKTFGNVRRDTFPRFGVRGCPAVKESVSINQAGDVYPCVFIHTRLGNLREESLHTILKRASQFRLFREHHPRCLSGEDQEFYDNFLSKTFGKPKPFDGIELYGLKNDQDDTGRA